jgi:REP element-mobilizing transposase RayT
MANTYSQIHIQTVFAVQERNCLIRELWKDELYKYITGIIQNHGHKLLAINGMPDHVHVFFGMRPAQSLSELMQNVKKDSSLWINEKGFVRGRFSWQEGYGALSYSKSNVDQVIEYIRNQEVHHRKTTFLEEYRDFLRKYGVDFDERFIFKQVEESRE